MSDFEESQVEEGEILPADRQDDRGAQQRTDNSNDNEVSPERISMRRYGNSHIRIFTLSESVTMFLACGFGLIRSFQANVTGTHKPFDAGCRGR
jgi:hypothetical protein